MFVSAGLETSLELVEVGEENESPLHAVEGKEFPSHCFKTSWYELKYHWGIELLEASRSGLVGT